MIQRLQKIGMLLGMCVFGLAAAGQAQQTITGTVSDAATGQTLPGVNIRIAGTSQGTSTDAGGRYRLTVDQEAAQLVFSFVGYRPQTIRIQGRSEIDVELQPAVELLDDVVVTALGINRDERSIGYSTQEVEGENLTFAKEQNVIGSLAGKVAGVRISGSSGASMGGTQTIKIRGINSLSGEGQPLIVVDGTPVSNANFAGSAGADYGNLAQDINPNDIKSVNILKGPAASALYGIRGQYGVVMITTKDGAGKEDFTVELNTGASIQRAGNFMEFQNQFGGGYSLDFLSLAEDGSSLYEHNGNYYREYDSDTDTYSELYTGEVYPGINYGADESWGPRMDGTMIREYFSWYPQDPQYGELTPFDPQPNNIKNFFETGVKLDQGLTISGGGDNSNFRLSFGDSRVTGVYPNTWLKRNNLGLSAGIDVSDQWNFSTNINYTTNSAQRPPRGSEYGSRYFRQWFQRNVDMERLKNYQYPDGTIMHWNIEDYGAGQIPNANYWDNPYFLAYENLNQDSRNRIFGDIGVKFDAMPGLTFSGFIRGDIYVQNIEHKTAFGGTAVPGYSVGKYENSEMNYELSAQYMKDWKKFSLDATLGTNLYDRTYSYLYQATVGGLTTPGYYNINASVDRPANSSYLLEKKILSAYGLVSLGYDDTYYIDLSLRNDKSSTLPKSNNSYWYPSISGSFVFSELVDWKPLTFGKLRASYAQAGSDLSPYETTPVYSVGSVYSGINTLSVPNSINNPYIKPSFSHSYEAGVDLRFFGRLGINFTYYEQKNRNQIIPLNISGASGFSSAIINAGLIENKGIELSISGTPVQNQDFSWDATFNLARNQNKVVRLHPDVDVYSHDYAYYSGTYSYLNSYEGKSYGSLVGQAYQRDPETGKILLDDNNLPMWTDATHNFGTVLPDFTGGLQNIIQYKNFSLGAMIDYQIGGQFFSRSLMLAAKTGLAPVTAEMNDRGHNVREPVSEGGGVKVEGISASTGEPVTAYVDARSYYNGVIGDDIYEDWVIDASYIKLSEVKLGYTFSGETLKNLPVQSVEVSVFSSNPLMIWQKAPKGLDPSELSAGSQDIAWYESGQLNTVRTYGFNLSLTF